jgi:tetratricopeptide (TPR) repeat protein
MKYYVSAIFVAGIVGTALYVAAQPKAAGQGKGTAKAKPARGPAQPSALPPGVAECETLRRHGDPGEKACYTKLTRSNDPMARAEGFWGLKDYNSANDLYREFAKAHPNDPTPLVRWGRMYLEHWQPGDAGDLFGEALDIDPKNAQAMLGMAMVLGESFSGKAVDYAERAIETDPKLAEAYEVMARIALEDNNPEKAVIHAKKALEVSGEAIDAMAILATVDLLDDKTNSEWLPKLFRINPKYGEAYATAGYFFVINRRYAEGIAYYRKALEMKPDLYSAQSELGINLMRFGQEQEARKLLEDAYEKGYRNAATANSLKLLDSYKNFETFKTPATTLILHKKEAEILKPYFQAEMDRAIATYEKKYKFKLKGPVQLEVYPDHEDFAVRTMGMPGLGALGVTFGQYVAMDSPSGRKPGDFHWASTLWHEFSHVYVLSMTNHRVPRWFTEGVAVYEETAASPDWGDRLDHPSILAIKEHKLLPIAELDRGYIHPTYPEQVVVSYFQGGRVISFIVEKFGYDKVLAMIRAFGNKKTTAEVIEQELKMKPEEFDKQFLPWLEAQTKRTVEGFDEWAKRVKGINELAKNKDWSAVIKEGNEIRDIYPDYVEAGSVYEFLSQAYLEKGDKANAIKQLEAYSKVGGRNPGTLKKLADLETEAGNKKEAVAALERLNLIYLGDETAHRKLGELYTDLNNPNLAIREFQTVLAAKPVDRAQAHFQLAKALQMAKRTDDAREEVYNALEAAPNFKPAQKMLLELGNK